MRMRGLSTTKTNKPRYSDTISLFSKYLVFIILQWFTNILSLSLMYIRNIDNTFCNIKEQVNDVNECQHDKTLERPNTRNLIPISVENVIL